MVVGIVVIIVVGSEILRHSFVVSFRVGKSSGQSYVFLKQINLSSELL